MKCLSIEDANLLLANIGMRIGEWNQIVNNTEHQYGKNKWVSYLPPRDGRTLLNFSQHVVGWLPKGNWKIFQIDNSTGWMDPVQCSLFNGLLFGLSSKLDINYIKNRTLLFECGEDNDTDLNTELLISNLVYIFLLFESHGYLVSSDSYNGQLLGIQDGVVYFCSQEKLISSVNDLLKKFEHDPLASPQWVTNAFIARQEEFLNNLPTF